MVLLQHFLQTLHASGKAASWITLADAPTVTMPRIKALTTGSIPSFLDAIMNFGAKILTEDNIIAILTEEMGKKIAFYGDDTWITLFPQSFFRKEGVVSFNVEDHTVVDLNVTRHVANELHATDWDVLVLHYLGVDHIGHMEGPSSSKMPPKLQEMDDIIRTIYQALGADDVLLLVSDHGMTSVGSHGGSTFLERSSILSLISPRLFLSLQSSTAPVATVFQTDLVVTLAELWGARLPCGALGMPIVPLLKFMQFLPREIEEIEARALQRIQRLGLEPPRRPWTARSILAWAESLRYSRWKPSVLGMYTGLVLCLLSVIASVKGLGGGVNLWSLRAMLIMILVFGSSFTEAEGHIEYYFFATTQVYYLILILIPLASCQTGRRQKLQRTGYLLLSLALGRLALDYCARYREGIALEDQWVGWERLLPSKYPFLYALLVCYSPLLIIYSCRQRSTVSMSSKYMNAALVTFLCLSRFMSMPLIESSWWPSYLSFSPYLSPTTFAQLNIAISFLWWLLSPSSNFLSLSWLLVSFVTRPVRIPLLCILLLWSHTHFAGGPADPASRLLDTLALGRVGWYLLGNSNTLSTLDVYAAFVGQASFFLPVSAFTFFIGTYAAMILMTCEGVSFLRQNRAHCHFPTIQPALASYITVITVRALLGTILLIFMQEHLFLWSVFAPKLLYVTSEVLLSILFISPILVAMVLLTTKLNDTSAAATVVGNPNPIV